MNQCKKSRQYENVTDIFGTATSFKLRIGFAWLNRSFKAIIHSLNAVDKTQIMVHRCSETFSMSLNNTNVPPFLTFVGPFDDITIFSPDKQEPIGKIVRRKAVKVADDEADIFCFATSSKFTLKNVVESDDDSPPSMKIFDSNGIVLGAASVSKWRGTGKFRKIKLIQELSFHISDGIPEPIKTMLVVAFTNWGRWSKLEFNGRKTYRLATRIMIYVFLLSILAIIIICSCMAFKGIAMHYSN